MDESRIFLKSLCCCSLKVGVVIIGVTGLIYDFLYYIDSLVQSIIFLHKGGHHGPVYFHAGLELLLYESSLTLTLVFWIYLLYAAFTESKRKSTLLIAWMIYRSSYIPVAFFSLFTIYVIYEYDSLQLLVEELLLMCLSLFEIYIVYCYYRTIPKHSVYLTHVVSR